MRIEWKSGTPYVDGEPAREWLNIPHSTCTKLWLSRRGDVVIKEDLRPMTNTGQGQANLEAKVWEDIPIKLRRYFAPVIDYGDGWIAKKYIADEGEPTQLHKDFVRLLCNELGLLGWDIVDSWGWNVVMNDGRPVILDWGVSR